MIDHMDARPFSIVFGYLAGIDRPYAPAVKADLDKRFAIVLGSYRPSLGEMYYDWEMLFEILVSVSSMLDFDQVHVQYNGKTEVFKSIDGLEPGQIVKLGDEDDHFGQLIFLKEDSPVCIVNPEPYYAIGGPSPYHDSFTFSFYVDEYDQSKIVGLMDGVAGKLAYILQDAIIGNEKPEISLTDKLRKWF